MLRFRKTKRALLSPSHLNEASPLESQGILVDADGHFVLHDAAGFIADGAQVVGHEQRSSHDRPQSHLSARLLHAEAEVADNQLLRRNNDTIKRPAKPEGG